MDVKKRIILNGRYAKENIPKSHKSKLEIKFIDEISQ